MIQSEHGLSLKVLDNHSCPDNMSGILEIYVRM